MSLIVPGNLPGVGLDVDAVVAQAEVLKGLGSSVSNGGAATLRAWQKLPASYQSDGSEHLYDVMTPVGAAATSVGDGFLAVAAALSAYAETVRPIQAALKTLRADATAFAHSAKNFKPHDEATTDIWVKLSNPVDFIDAPKTQITSWDQDPTMVDKNNALIRKGAALEQQWLEAQQTCSNAILAAGGSGVHAIAGQKTPAQIMAQAEKTMVTQDGTTSTPWGATSSRKESCGEKALGFPAHLVGGVLTGALGILKGVSSLVLGWDGTGTPWEVQLVQGLVSGDGAKESAAWSQAGQTYSGSWLGLSHLANSLNPVNDVMDGIALSPLANVMPASMRKYMQDNAHADGTALAGAVGGLVGLKVPDQWWTAKAWDGFNPAQSWVDDPGGTLGSSALNVGSLFVGGGGAASGVGHAAEGAADASEAVDAASGAGHAADAGGALADVSKATEGDLAAAGVKGLDGADVSHSVDGLKVDVGDNGLSDSLGKLKTFNEHDVPATHDLDRTPAEVTHSWQGEPARSEDAIHASQADAAASHAPAGDRSLVTAGGAAEHSAAAEHAASTGDATHGPSSELQAPHEPGHPEDSPQTHTNDSSSVSTSHGGSETTSQLGSGGADGGGSGFGGGDHGGDGTGGEPHDAGSGDTPGHEAPPQDGPGTTPPTPPVRLVDIHGKVFDAIGAPSDIAHATPSIDAIRASLAEHGSTVGQLQHLAHDVPFHDLTGSEAKIVYDSRHAVPEPGAGEIMQKIIDRPTVMKLINHVYPDGGQLRGFVSKAVDALPFNNPHSVFNGLGLDFKGTHYAPTEGASFAIRFENTPGITLDIPDGDLAHLLGKDGYVDPQNHYYPGDPFHGNGYAGKGYDGILPEYVAADGSRLPSGSEIWQILKDGSQQPLARLDTDGATWVPVGLK